MNKKKITKEILSFLLKKYLDDNLKKLEENNLKENNILCSIKESTNNMKKFLEESSKIYLKVIINQIKQKLLKLKIKIKLLRQYIKKEIK